MCKVVDTNHSCQDINGIKQWIDEQLSDNPSLIKWLDGDGHKDFILQDDIFRYCSEEEKQNILQECGIE